MWEVAGDIVGCCLVSAGRCRNVEEGRWRWTWKEVSETRDTAENTCLACPGNRVYCEVHCLDFTHCEGWRWCSDVVKYDEKFCGEGMANGSGGSPKGECIHAFLLFLFWQRGKKDWIVSCIYCAGASVNILIYVNLYGFCWLFRYHLHIIYFLTPRPMLFILLVK